MRTFILTAAALALMLGAQPASAWSLSSAWSSFTSTFRSTSPYSPSSTGLVRTTSFRVIDGRVVRTVTYRSSSSRPTTSSYYRDNSGDFRLR